MEGGKTQRSREIPGFRPGKEEEGPGEEQSLMCPGERKGGVLMIAQEKEGRNGGAYSGKGEGKREQKRGGGCILFSQGGKTRDTGGVTRRDSYSR